MLESYKLGVDNRTKRTRKRTRKQKTEQTNKPDEQTDRWITELLWTVKRCSERSCAWTEKRVNEQAWSWMNIWTTQWKAVLVAAISILKGQFIFVRGTMNRSSREYKKRDTVNYSLQLKKCRRNGSELENLTYLRVNVSEQTF